MSPLRLFHERDRRALAIILPYLVRYRWQVLLAFGCLLAITGATLIVPILMKQIVDRLSPPGAQAVAVPMSLLLGYGIVRFASVLFRELRATVFGRVSVR